MTYRSGAVVLNMEQLDFIMEFTEINEPNLAVDKFITIMIEEKANPAYLSLYVDRLIQMEEFF